MTGSANHLPVELWARIFGILQPPFLPGILQSEHRDLLFACQSSFWQLQSVCMAFQATFKRHPELCSHIYISDQMLEEAESSLLAWLRAHGSVLKAFRAFSEHAQIPQCLLALSDADCSLEFASLRVASQAALNSLGAFTALTTCFLRGHSPYLGSPNVDLTPLQTLDTLTSLGLEEGRFTSVNAAGHLTSLEVLHARVMSSSDCAFCTCLVKLQITHNGVVDIHARGLCACTALQLLEVGFECKIRTQDRSNPLSTCGYLFVLPSSISCLTALTTLNLNYNSWQQADLSRISTLASLEALTLVADGSFGVNQEFEALTRLTRLSIRIVHRGSTGEGYIDMSFNWGSLQALQTLYVLSRYTLDETVLELTELQHLELVYFLHAQPIDLVNVDVLTIVENRFAAKKPSVVFRLGGFEC